MIVLLIAVLLIISLDFVAVEVLPGDPTRVLLPRGGSSNIVREWGLDGPVFDRWVVFVENILSLNWGPSIAYRPGVPVLDLLALRVGMTTTLLAAAGAIGLGLAGLVAWVAHRRRPGGVLERSLTLISFAAYSIPVYVLSVLLSFVLAVQFQLFPIGGDRSIVNPPSDLLGQVADRLYHGILPVAALSAVIVGLAFLSIRENLDERFARGPMADPGGHAPAGLRSRGPPPISPVTPMVGVIVLYGGWLVSADAFVEALFNLDGIGRLAWNAILTLDFFLLSGIFLLASFTLAVITTVAGIVYHGLSRFDEERLAPEPRVDGAKAGLAPNLVPLVRRPTSIVGLALVSIMIGFVLFAPLLVGPPPTALQRDTPLQPPSDRHLLGTDRSGFDVAALLAYGGGESLLAAGWSFDVAFAIGLSLLIAVGYFSRRTAFVSAAATDFFLMIPWIWFAVLIMGVVAVGGGRFDTTLVVALLAWPVPVRALLWRVESRTHRMSDEQDPLNRTRSGLLELVESSLPLALSGALFAASLGILMDAGLEFMGFSSSAIPSWGLQIANSYTSLDLLRDRWWTFVLPGLLIGLASFGFGLLSDGLGRRPIARPLNAA